MKFFRHGNIINCVFYEVEQDEVKNGFDYKNSPGIYIEFYEPYPDERVDEPEIKIFSNYQDAKNYFQNNYKMEITFYLNNNDEEI